MHERSLARSILRQIEELGNDYPKQRITSVELEVGLMSGVEADLLGNALHEEQTNEKHSVAFVLQVVPLQAKCSACQSCFEMEGFSFVCVQCGADELDITHGDSVQIMTVTLEEALA
jgi:hydrogenase nickel incorporation protein HypA/HybF